MCAADSTGWRGLFQPRGPRARSPEPIDGGPRKTQVCRLQTADRTSQLAPQRRPPCTRACTRTRTRRGLAQRECAELGSGQVRYGKLGTAVRPALPSLAQLRQVQPRDAQCTAPKRCDPDGTSRHPLSSPFPAGPPAAPWTPTILAVDNLLHLPISSFPLDRGGLAGWLGCR